MMTRVVIPIAAILGACCGTYLGIATVAQVPVQPYVDRLESWGVHDGDTLSPTIIDLGYGVLLRDRIRIIGIDAPEVFGEQRPAGLVVRDAAAGWLSQHKDLWFLGNGRDKYGRLLGDVQPRGGGQSLGEWLIENGYAHSYDGKGERPEWTEAELRRITEGKR